MKQTHALLSGLALTLLLTGCGGGGSDSGSNNNDGSQAGLQDPFSQVTLNATSDSAYTYFNFTTGQVVNLTDEQAASSSDWHIAFRRNNAKLNSGASGPANVRGAVVAAQNDFYGADGEPNASVFLNATADSEKEHLLASYTAPARLVNEAVSTVLAGSGAMVGGLMDLGWYWYNRSAGHTLSLNDSNGWLLRSGEGNSYARFRATAFTYSQNDGLDATFSFDVQTDGASQFTSTATFNAQIGAAGGEVCFDFDADAAADCDSTQWDLKVGMAGRDIYLRSNGGASGAGAGAALGPFAWDGDLENYTSATIDSAGNDIAARYLQDVTGGVFAQSLWYAYNLTGAHKLHPNYRVYWIDTDSTNAAAPKYAMQVASYYSTTGTSGMVTLRWIKKAGN